MNQNWNNSNYQDARYAELGSAVNPKTNPDWGPLKFFMAPPQQNQQINQNKQQPAMQPGLLEQFIMQLYHNSQE